MSSASQISLSGANADWTLGHAGARPVRNQDKLVAITARRAED